MADMNVALIIRFLTEGAQRVQKDINALREGATAFKQEFSGAIRQGFSGDNIDAALKDAETKLNRARGRLMDAVAMGAALAAPVRAAAEFEEAFADLDKVLDVPVAKVNEIRSSILAMSREIALSSSGLTQIMASAAQAGIPTDQLERFTAYTARAAVAFDMAAGEIGNRFAKLRNVYRLDQEGLEELADAANHLSNRMAARADEITNFTNRAAGAQRVLKLSAVEMEAVGAALVAAGIVPETAARGLTGFANRLAQGTDQVREAFAGVGMSYEDFMASLDQDAPAAIVNLFRTLSEAGNVEGAQALIGMMGQDFSDDFGKLLNNPDLLASAFRMVGDASAYAGSAVAEYDKRAATTMGRAELLKNQASAIAVTLGNTLLPMLNQVMEKATGAANALGELANAHPQLVTAITGSVAALLTFGIASRAIGYGIALVRGPLIGLVGLFLRFDEAGKNVSIVARAVGLLGPAFTIVRTAAMAAFATIGTVTAPVWGTILAIAAALFLVWKYWDRLSSFIGGFAAGVMGALSPVGEAVSSFANSLAELLGIDLSPIAAMFGRIAEGIGNALSTLGSMIGSFFSAEELTDEQKAAIRASGEQLGRQLVEAIRDGVVAAWNIVVEWFTAAIAKLGELLHFNINFAWPEPPGWLKGMFGGGAAEPAADTSGSGGAIPPLGAAFDGGNPAANASTKIKTDAGEAGKTLGKTAGAELHNQASTAGQAFGRAAAAEISRAKVNFTPLPPRASSAVGASKTGALHDGVE